MPGKMPFWMTKLGQLWRLVRESHAAPMAGGGRVPEAVAGDEAGVTFIGHSSFLLRMAGRAVLVDPVFAKRLILLRRAAASGGDGAEPAGDRRGAADACAYGPSEFAIVAGGGAGDAAEEVAGAGRDCAKGVEDLVRKVGFREVRELRWWDSTEVEGITVTATPAKHWGARMFKDTHRGLAAIRLLLKDADDLSLGRYGLFWRVS